MGDIRTKLKVALTGLMVATGLLAICSSAAAVTAGAGKTFPVSWLPMEADSIPGSNSGANGAGYAPSPLSTDGRFVLFTSMSDNLVSDNDLNTTGLFRRDMQNGEIVLVSRLNGKNGAPIKGGFYDFKMDGSGNRVVFTTDQQLTGDDTDDQPDAYMRDIAAGTTTLVSPDTSLDVINPAISADGQYITFSTLSALVPGDLNGKYDVYRRKVSDGTVGIVSRIPAAATAGDSDSFSSGISGDGRWVAFSSRATNLVAGFVENNSAFATDVFVRDMVSGNTYLVSSRFNSSLEGANDGSEDPVIAGTPGTLNTVRVAFTSYSTNLADNGVSDSDTAASVYLKSFPSQASVLVSRASGATGENANSRAHTPSISDNASRIVFTSDAGNLGAGDNYYGTYLRNLTDNTTTLVSNDNSYAVWGQISGNGATASWDEAGGGTPDSDPDLGCVFRRTFSGDIVRLVSRPKGSKKVAAPGFASYSGHDSKRALSADGRYMVFATWSSHLPSSEIFQQQIYRRDLKTGKIEVVSRASGANGALAEVGFAPSISGNGNLVAFTAAGQLDPADTNDRSDIYVRNMSTGTTTLVSRADGPDGAVSDEGGHYPSISTDGTRVAYSSEASNMGAPGGHEIVYVRDLGSGTTSIASRATGLAGAIANQYSSDPMMNGDGSLVVFGSNATNLSPDDGASSNSIYLRNIDTGETLLVSRNPGLTGTSLPNYVYDGAINSDGTKVAFVTANDTAVPATAPWPAGQGQVVIRTIADGANSLGSSTPDGVVGNDRSDSPSFSGDGGILAFVTTATNIRADVDVTDSHSVVVKNLADGTNSGPPMFGDPDTELYGSSFPQVSDNGNCVLFVAQGHNAVTGDLGDFQSTYVYVRNGTCQDPKALVPKLTNVSIKPAKFRAGKKATAKSAAKRKRKAPVGTKIRFRLNTAATVTIRIDQKLKGRKVGKKCVKPKRSNERKKACKRLVFRGKLIRKNVGAGNRKVAFSGRIGRKALKPGKYRIVMLATGPGGKSAKVYRSFRIVKR